MKAIAESMVTGRCDNPTFKNVVWMAQQSELVKSLRDEKNDLTRAIEAMVIVFKQKLVVELEEIHPAILKMISVPELDRKQGNTVLQPDLGRIRHMVGDQLLHMDLTTRTQMLSHAVWFAFPDAYPCDYIEKQKKKNGHLWYSDLANFLGGMLPTGGDAWNTFVEAYDRAAAEFLTELRKRNENLPANSKLDSDKRPQKLVNDEISRCLEARRPPVSWRRTKLTVVFFALIAIIYLVSTSTPCPKSEPWCWYQ